MADRPTVPSARALDLARGLVRLDAVSTRSNLALIHLLRDELTRVGLTSG